MMFGLFLANVLRFPFRAQIFVFTILIFSAATSVSAQSSGNVQSADDTRQMSRRAKKLAGRGEYAEAEKLLRRVLETDSRDSKAKLNLAFVLFKQRRVLEAYEYSLEVAKAEPQNSRAFAVLGVILLEAGNFRQAELSFLNALQLDKKEDLAWFGLGTLSFYENHIFTGLEQVQSAVFLEPSEPDYLFTLAQIASRAEDYKLAAQAYEKFLQISPQTDSERRARIKGLINFLNFLGAKSSLYGSDGETETVVSVRMVNDRPIIQLKINDRQEPFNFVLDTGSGISVISGETAERLKIKAISRGGLARGVGGDGKFEIVYGFLRSIQIGAVKIRSVPVYIRDFHTRGDKIDGYIGLSLISKFLTTIDYGNSTFALRKKLAVAVQTADDKESSLPLRLTSSGFLSGEVKLEGLDAPYNFIVDTGASISVISDKIAASKEISPFVSLEKMRVVGAAGIIEDVPLFLLPKISFGANSRQSIKAVALNLAIINETAGFEQAGILGGNFLKNYRLTFDFANSKVVFVPVK